MNKQDTRMILFCTGLVLILIPLFWYRDVIIDSQRDISKVALLQQANVTSVRKSNETALYRNFMVPLQFPLNSGLALSLGYKIRNGNFGDLWNAIMEINKNGNNSMSIMFDNEKYKLSDINGMCLQLLNNLGNMCKNIDKGNEPIIVGINVPITTLPGFVISLACVMHTIKKRKEKGEKHCQNIIPQLIPMIPRSEMKNRIDILVIDSINKLKRLEDSKTWYSKIIICKKEDIGTPKDDVILPWQQLIQGYIPMDTFNYSPPLDNSDELKPFMNIAIGDTNFTTCFNQLNLVSSVSTFIKSFPVNHELDPHDVLSVFTAPADVEFQLQMWPKILAVLLYGGSITMTNISDKTKELDISMISKKTTLLFMGSNHFKIMCQKDKWFHRSNLIHSLKLTVARFFIKSGVLHSVFFKSPCKSLRCTFLCYPILRHQELSEFDPNKKPPTYNKGQFNDSLSIQDINDSRILLRSRIIVELYAANLVLGPLSHTNFYDYRTLPQSTENQVTSFGAISMSLEAKLIETEKNPQFNIVKRQGMLCVRGFTIGRPLESERIACATKLSELLAHGEGWMPLIGIYGLWGHDGCLYLFK